MRKIITILVLALAGAAAADTTTRPAATRPAATQPAQTIDAMLNAMPRHLWPDPKGNNIREGANGDSRTRYIEKNIIGKPVRLLGYVGSVSRTSTHILFSVATEAKGTTTINGELDGQAFKIEVPGKRNEAMTVWGVKRGMCGAVCVPKLLASGEVPIEPLLELKMSQRVLVVGEVESVDVTIEPGRAEGMYSISLNLKECRFTRQP